MVDSITVPARDARSFVVPAGHVWLQGDNRNDSADSRNYGPVPLALVRGRVLTRIFPLAKLGAVPDNDMSDLVLNAAEISVKNKYHIID